VTVKEALRATRDRLVTHGWTQGSANCVLTTLERAIPDGLWATIGQDTLKALRAKVGLSVVQWNIAQTHIDGVLAVLAAVIEELP
jgi:hypothetical protein